MKKLLSILFLLGMTWAVSAQKDEISMRSILENAGEYVNLIERELEQEIVRMEFDIIHSSKHTYRTLTDDYEYGICAFGDFRIKDIDVRIYKWVDDKWVLIDEDEDSSSVAVVSVKPSTTAEYKIEISAYSFEEGHDVGHYGLLIFHE